MKWIYFSFFLFIFSSCSSGIKTENKSQLRGDDSISSLSKDSSFQTGTVIPKIECKTNAVINYALYLPQKYSSTKKSPVIFFFDSHGSGDLPLKKYKDLAEKYGYILAGSNNSKNGMRWEDNEPQIKIFMQDVKTRLNIDPKRIYVCGFSGGSRVASSVAIFDGGVAGVIGMGAGLPSLNEPIRNKFDYIGFAGNEDFNMNEMIVLDSSMSHSPFRHQLIIFNGKHEWAPAEVAEDAFIWSELNAMKDGLIAKNDTLIKNFISRSDSKRKEFEAMGFSFDEYVIYKKIENYLTGLSDVSEFKLKADKTFLPKDLIKESERRNKLMSEEMKVQEAYRNNFTLKDLKWWISEINSRRSKAKGNSQLEETQMSKRILSYLSLLAYMNCSADMQQKQYDLLEKHLKIYEMAEPSNSEHQYMFAELYAIKNNNDKALSYLENAAKLGFNDVVRLEDAPYFSSMKSSERFSKISEEIKNAKHD